MRFTISHLAVLVVLLAAVAIIMALAWPHGTACDGTTAVTCKTNSDCGPSGFYGSAYCKDGNVWRGYYANVCTGQKGTCTSRCDAQQTERLVKTCKNGCSQGACVA